MRTILHIGLHKTGTTFLQQAVFPHLKNYRLLTRPFTQHNHAFNQLQYADDSLYDPKAVRKEIERLDGNSLLISDESFGGKPIGFGFINRTMIAKRFKEAFPDAEIVLFIRGQQDMLVSQYNTWVKGSYEGQRSIEDFLWFPKRDFHELEANTAEAPYDSLYWNTNKFYLHLDAYLYYPLIKLYKDLFSKVHVWLYEDLRSDPREMVNRFEALLGEEWNLPDDVLTQPVNKSIDVGTLQARLRRSKARNFTDSRLLQPLLAGIASTPDLDHDRLKQKVDTLTSAHYVDDNRRIIEAFPEIGLQRYPANYRV